MSDQPKPESEKHAVDDLMENLMRSFEKAKAERKRRRESGE